MAESALVKGLGGAGVIGATGAGGYLVYENYSSNTIAADLIGKGLNVLSFKDEDDSKWETIAASYKDAKGKDNGVDKFIEGEIANAPADKGKFKDPCKEVLSKKFTNSEDKDFKNASRWCVEKETVQKTLKRKGLKFIEEENNDEEWNKAVSRTSGKVKKENADYTKETLKVDCKSKKEKYTTDKDYWSERDFVSKYCVKSEHFPESK